MIISFDFDGVLSNVKGRNLAIDKQHAGNEIWIITARRMDENDRVFEIAQQLNIPKTHVVFTNGMDKWKFMERFNISVHYDNNPEQIDKINKNTKTRGILFTT